MLLQKNLKDNSDINKFLKEFNSKRVDDLPTHEKNSIIYQGKYRAYTNIREGKGIIFYKDWTFYAGEFKNHS